MKTYDRILAASLQLFNEQGERQVSTNHIAAHLGISPGNLYYHFRHKEAIVHQIFLQYQDFIRARLTLPSERSLQVADMLGYLDSAFDGMWQYRFLFYDLPGLLARNPPLQQAYQQFLQEELNHTLHTLCQRAVDAGLLTLDASDINPLVVNIWLVVKFWFAFEQVAQPSQAVSEASGRRGVSQVLALLKPYVADTLRPGFALAQARYGGAD
jgi:AcrR family transcriptional regulator